jgi:MFS family permease
VIGWSALPGVVAVVVLAVVLKGERADGQPDSRTAGQMSPSAAPSVRRSDSPPDRLSGRPLAFWPPILALTALTFFRLPETLLILRIQDQGVPVAAVPLVWAGLHVVRSASSYPGGWLSDRAGPRLSVALGGVLFAALVFVLGTAVGPTGAVGIFLGLGLVAGLTESGERVLVGRLAPKTTGRGFGIYHALTGGVALPAGLLFGALYQAKSGSVALWTAAAGMAAAVVLWLMVSPRSSANNLG